jgi:hypothetical protein
MPNPWLPRWDDGVFRYDRGWLWPTDEEVLFAKTQPYLIHPMRRQAYYPSRITEQIPWLQNIATKLPGYETPLGLEGATVDANVAGCLYAVYVLNQWLPAVRAFGPTSTAALDLLLSGSGPDAQPLPAFSAPALPTGVVAVPPGVLPRLFDLVASIKTNPAYTPAIGQDLQIIGAEDGSTHDTPGLTATAQDGATQQAALLKFTKYGHMGVYIESQRGTGGWEFLTIDTESPYLDERPLLVAGTPEVRKYRARFWDKGTPNGDWTDVVEITLAP